MNAESAINMHQINLDPLLRITGQSQTDHSVRLDPAQYYPARLQITADGGTLNLQTGSSQLQMQLSAFQVRQILQSTTSNGSASPAVTLQTPAPASQNTTTLTAALSQPTSAPLTQQPTNGLTSEAGLLKLQVRLQSVGTQEVLLTVRPISQSMQFALSNQALLTLLAQPPQAAGTALSQTARLLAGNQLTANVATNAQLGTVLGSQLYVQLTKVGTALQLQIADEAPVRISLDSSSAATQWPERGQRVQLRLLNSGQLEVSALPNRMESTGKPELSAAPGKTSALLSANSANSLTSINQTASQQRVLAPLLIDLQAVGNKTLLPALARQLWPTQVSSQLLAQLTSPNGKPADNTPSSATQVSTATLAAANKDSFSWQLQPTKQGFVLQLQPLAEPQNIRLNLDAASRPLVFQQATKAPTQLAPQAIKDLWRQLLPLSPQQADPLALTDDLPVPVRQVMQFLQQQHPDGKTVLSSPQVLQQLQAASQFQPMQTQPALNSAAGALAAAIGLLLGRLSSNTASDKPTAVGREKLQLLVNQLDKPQSSQLLKQLAGHSGQMQASQLANLEQAQQKPNEQQLFLTLPLLCGNESRLAELCIHEQPQPQSCHADKANHAWQLTMKFNLGEHGELLAKVRLQSNQLSMQFYTENPQVVSTAERFLPLLKDRFKVQGLQVDEISCQQGRIPAHLYQQGNQLLQVRV